MSWNRWRVALGLGGILVAAMMAQGCAGGVTGPVAPEPSVDQGTKSEEPSPRQRAKSLAEQMTLEEKVAYLGGHDEFYIRGIERLGIPPIKMADGPVGCRNWGPSTAYPASIALAASFSPELAGEVGAAIARDCRARGVHILLAPAVNIQRSPLNGRNFEYLGEDPWLARRVAVDFIRGVQGGGVMATVKHFVANNQEWDRNHVSSELSERALREIYFPAFEGAVKEAQVASVMTAYNPVNGAFSSHNSFLLRDVLREDWNFDGFVMSDWRAVHDTEGAVIGGTDLEMPSAQFMTLERMTPLLEAGTLTESQITEKVENILTGLIRFGFLEGEQLVEAPVADERSAEVALTAARKGVVLLKNAQVAGDSLLPLDVSKLKKIAVVGPNASPGVHGGSGSAYVTPVQVVSLVDGIRSAAPEIEVVSHSGIQEYSEFSFLGAAVFEGPVKQEVFEGKELAGSPVSTTSVDRVDFRPDGKAPVKGVGPENYSVRWTGQVRLEGRQALQFMTNADDGVRVFVDGKKVLDDWSDHAPRMQAEMVTLSSGRHEIVVEYFQGILGSICQFGVGPKVKPGDLHGHGELSSTLGNADVIIVGVGYGQSSETNSLGTSYPPFWPSGWARAAGIVEAEDDDRKFELPSAQVATIQAAVKTGKPVVVVGYAGGGVDFEPWLSQVQGLLWAWYPGQEGGTALAEILFGAVNPSGRLPVTFARSYDDHPAADSYSLRGPLGEEEGRGAEARLELCEGRPAHGPFEKHGKSDKELFLSPYCEDIYVGYRGFDLAGTEPLYAFGFGLSYTSFEFDGLEVTMDAQGELSARLSVTNTGKRAGREVVQIYAAPKSAKNFAPQKLAAFQAVELRPGETRRVELKLDPRSFAMFDAASGDGWVQPAGEVEVRASASSRDHRLRHVLKIPEKRKVP